MSLEAIVQIVRTIIQFIPTKGAGIWLGDKNKNKIVDVTVTIETNGGKKMDFGPFDIPMADVGSLTEQVLGLVGGD